MGHGKVLAGRQFPTHLRTGTRASRLNHCNNVITSLGEERSVLYVFRACVCLSGMRHFLFFVFLLVCHGLAAACDCGTPWTFHLCFMPMDFGSGHRSYCSMVN